MRRRVTSPQPASKTAIRSSPVLPALPAWLTAVLLAAATIALYWPALHCGFINNYDDSVYVTANPHVKNGLTVGNIRWAFSSEVAGNWHPLTLLSHMLVCQFSGLNPWAHHLANVLLHAANAVLVFLLLRRLTNVDGKSLVVAALFAAHPLHVESVAWVAERKDVLSGFFGLLALIFYARHAQAHDTKSGDDHSLFSRAYWLACMWFALGLMSKPMLVTWPFVLLLLDFWPLERFHRGCAKQLILEKIPFLALAVPTSVATYIFQKQADAVDALKNMTLGTRGENALMSYCRYLEKMFWPTDLAVFYPYPRHWPAANVLLAGGFLTTVSVLLVTQRRKHPCLLMGWLWFLITLVPVIGLVQVGLQSIADRYTYLPSLGILILIVWGVAELGRHWQPRAGPLAVFALAPIVLCAVMTRIQLQYWQDGETLFRHTVAVTRNNYIAHFNIGVALDDKNQNEGAIIEYQTALQIRPDYAPAHINLGINLEAAGQTDQAMRQYQEAVRVAPSSVSARNKLGLALFRQGQTTNAIDEFEKAIHLAPNNAIAHNNLGTALYAQGRSEEAIHEFQEALRLSPDYPEAHFDLACALAKRGQTSDAVKHFQEAIRLKPDYTEARAQLAQILEMQGKSN